jgi:hypothetical protein
MTGKAAAPRLVDISSAQPRAPVSASDATTSDRKAAPREEAVDDAAERASSPAGEPRNSGAVALLQLQAEMRKARNSAELGYFIANEARGVLRAQQIIVLARNHRQYMAVHTVSSLTSVERSAPLILWFELMMKSLETSSGLDRIAEFDAGTYASAFDDIKKSYPLRNLLWVPWPAGVGPVNGGMLLARAAPWNEQEIKLASYLGGAFAHAWTAIERPRAKLVLSRLLGRRTLTLAAIIAIFAMIVPVPMTALAPVEVSPRDTYIVTPGIDGVVKSVHVEPNSPIKTGQVLVTLVDTILKNRDEIADHEVQVADSKYKKASLLAFVDARGRHEMAAAKSASLSRSARS